MVGENMTSRELVWLLLSKYRMRHRDPKVGRASGLASFTLLY